MEVYNLGTEVCIYSIDGLAREVHPPRSPVPQEPLPLLLFCKPRRQSLYEEPEANDHLMVVRYKMV